jgi:hypothetical protein
MLEEGGFRMKTVLLATSALAFACAPSALLAHRDTAADLSLPAHSSAAVAEEPTPIYNQLRPPQAYGVRASVKF